MGLSTAARRRVRAVGRHLLSAAPSAAAEPVPHPPLGSIEGDAPPLRSFTSAQLWPNGQPAPAHGAEVPEFPVALPADHPAVQQFQQLGYCAIDDALSGAALERVQATFRRGQQRARGVWRSMLGDSQQKVFLAGDSKETAQ